MNTYELLEQFNCDSLAYREWLEKCSNIEELLELAEVVEKDVADLRKVKAKGEEEEDLKVEVLDTLQNIKQEIILRGY